MNRLAHFGILGFALLGICVQQSVLAEETRRPDAPLYDTPVYDPNSKSYFVLVNASNSVHAGYNGRKWKDAMAEAKGREYKGVRGRLAIVDSVETHEFLLQTFHPDRTSWIGFRYLCAAKLLEDAGGKTSSKPSFSAWAKNWKQFDAYACASGTVAWKDEYAGIAYSSTANGFRWIGAGYAKEFDAYFLEFPVGHP